MSLAPAFGFFTVVATVVVGAGTQLSGGGDQLAKRTGFARLSVDTLLLAFATSLPDVVTEITGAVRFAI